jgi:Ca-activated chloride channel family protein
MHDAANIPFHLLRPLWLLALIPVAVIFGRALERNGAG